MHHINALNIFVRVWCWISSSNKMWNLKSNNQHRLVEIDVITHFFHYLLSILEFKCKGTVENESTLGFHSASIFNQNVYEMSIWIDCSIYVKVLNGLPIFVSSLTIWLLRWSFDRCEFNFQIQKKKSKIYLGHSEQKFEFILFFKCQIK